MAALIAFKQFRTLDEWPELHPKLRLLLSVLLQQWPTAYMVVTRVYDPPVPGESGVHRTRPHRAADLRTNTLAFEVGEQIEAWINERYVYDKAGSRPVALQHGDGPNRHLHLQVTNDTWRRPET